MDTESIRKDFQPEKVKLLLVGESPPHNGKFFYVKSTMTTYTSRPFENLSRVQFCDNQDFLKYFKRKDCFLEDLCQTPVDNLPNIQREQALIDSIPSFAKRIKVLNPEIVAIVLKKIDKYVREAIIQAQISPIVYTLPFPGNGHQNKYMACLGKILERHLRNET